jgi:hypothetical protein
MKLFPRQPWVPISLGIPCTHKIDCGMIENLWKEIDGYWAQRNMLAKHSMFS